ncbi:MAG: hypothetical protein ACK532_16080 [Acidobacteriota bacterium]
MEFQIAIFLLALGLLTSLYLWLETRVQMRRQDRNWRKEIEQIRLQVEEQRSRLIQTVRREDATLGHKAPMKAEVSFPLRTKAAPGAVSLWAGSTKMRAIEMVRRGDTSAKISAALSIPKPEIEFLIKMERATTKT